MALVGALAVPLSADACTGITLRSKDGTTVVARTIEWAGSNLNSQYVVVPRGYTQQSYTPDGGMNGMRFTARHGYVGFAVEQKEFIAEGLNEPDFQPDCFISLIPANIKSMTLPKRIGVLQTCSLCLLYWVSAALWMK